MLKKIAKKKILFCTGPPPVSTAWATHKIFFFFRIHVPQYMKFYFFFKSMYPGTSYFVFSSNPCTRIHGIFNFSSNPCTPMKFRFLSLFLCVAQALVGLHKKKYFGKFFSTCEKNNQFLEFWNDQGCKI